MNIGDLFEVTSGERLFNIGEALFWWGLGLALAIYLIAAKKFSVRLLTLSAVIVLFGVTDFLETGAWYSPWWLCVLNIGCVSAGVVLLFPLIRSRFACGSKE